MDSTAKDVVAYLRQHPNVLTEYVLGEVQLETVENWVCLLKNKEERNEINCNANNKTSNENKSRKKKTTTLSKGKLQDLVKCVKQKEPSQEQVLWEIANCISIATEADGFRLYLPDENEQLKLCKKPEFSNTEISNSSSNQCSEETKSRLDVPKLVMQTKKPRRSTSIDNTSLGDFAQFGENIDGIQEEEREEFTLCLPMQEWDDELSAVLELYRTPEGGEFLDEDKEEALNYMAWSSIALHYAKICNNMHRQRKLSDFLLDVVKSIFTDMECIDTLVIKIMDYAQRLVDADRASLFLLDENNYLCSKLFDVGDQTNSGCGSHQREYQRQLSEKIRFPIGTGIAGIVAQTGQILNITNVYADKRFNPLIDQQTGYKTKSILCMPVFRDKKTIMGVVQMVNKLNGEFTKEDEESFKTFAVYCGLALHHADLYGKIKMSEQKYKVALEVLSYHNSCSQEELEKVCRQPLPSAIPGIDDYFFDPFSLDDVQQVKHAIFMFKDLFGEELFDIENLFKFTLTVRKNYRRVPYHNWTHGFSVANTMYAIIKTSNGVFKLNEMLALYIGALCHDLDHRGKNNKFMLDTQAPLANIYSTSTMEHHHFNQTVTILQQDGHNIFSKLNSEDYKETLDLIKHCILATDLALFPETHKELQNLVLKKRFSFQQSAHKKLLQAIAMTASDLSASAKPWHIQEQTVKIIFKEFYDQGDEERAAGRTPIPMMDRNRTDEQAASQVGFLTHICTPCYTLLYQLVPETQPLLNQVNQNLMRWKEIDENTKGKK